MEKKKVRKEILTVLKGQDRTQKAHYDRRLAQRFFDLSAYQEANTLALYLAFDFEFNTSLLIDRALADGKRVLVPKTYPQGRMIFVTYEAEQLVKTHFGLLEPNSDEAVDKSEIDLIVVPGVAFNDQGFRIGYGAGYYDRYLADFQGQTLSLLYPSQLCHFQADDHDIPVKGLLYADDETLF